MQGEPVLRALDVLDRAAAREPASAKRSRALARYRAEAIALARAEGLGGGRYVFRILPLDAEPGEDGRLLVGGETLFAPRLLPASGRLTGLVCGAATLGPALAERVAALFTAGQRSLSLALDQLGNALLAELSRQMGDAMVAQARRQNLTLSGELRPGDPGQALDAQGPVLRLAAADHIGLTLKHGHLLNPLKSMSMVVGAGIDLPAAQWSRCDDCRSRATCRLVKAGQSEMVA